MILDNPIEKWKIRKKYKNVQNSQPAKTSQILCFHKYICFLLTYKT